MSDDPFKNIFICYENCEEANADNVHALMDQLTSLGFNIFSFQVVDPMKLIVRLCIYLFIWLWTLFMWMWTTLFRGDVQILIYFLKQGHHFQDNASKLQLDINNYNIQNCGIFVLCASFELKKNVKCKGLIQQTQEYPMYLLGYYKLVCTMTQSDYTPTTVPDKIDGWLYNVGAGNDDEK